MPAEESPLPPVSKCPRCGNPVVWRDDSMWKPFCSERCRLIDLGSWLSGKHAIPGDVEKLAQDDAGE